jgi:hypothetical protein
LPKQSEAIGCEVPEWNGPGWPGDYGVQYDQIYPEYLTDPNVLVCPSSGRNSGDVNNDMGMLFDDGSGLCRHVNFALFTSTFYPYLGYAIDNSDGDASTPTLNGSQYPWGDWLPDEPLSGQMTSIIESLWGGGFEAPRNHQDLP